MVVRCFEDDNVTHVEAHPDPPRDIEIIEIELALADLATMQKRLAKIEREARTNPKTRESWKPPSASSPRWRPVSRRARFRAGSLEARVAADSFLLTAKPLLYVANVDESQIGDPVAALVQAVRRSPSRRAAPRRALREGRSRACRSLRREAAEFRAELGMERSGLDELAVAAYDLLGLMTFLTAGEKEVRAWTIPRGHEGPEAAGTDPRRHRARLHPCGDRVVRRLRQISHDGRHAAAGRVRSEGRDYVMQEGDVVNFRFNV